MHTVDSYKYQYKTLQELEDGLGNMMQIQHQNTCSLLPLYQKWMLQHMIYVSTEYLEHALEWDVPIGRDA